MERETNSDLLFSPNLFLMTHLKHLTPVSSPFAHMQRVQPVCSVTSGLLFSIFSEMRQCKNVKESEDVCEKQQWLCRQSNFPHPPQLWHFCLEGKSCSALCSNLLLSVCVTSPKYSLSHWRPVQPVLCLCDAFTTLCPNPPHLPLCQGNFCLLRHGRPLLPHPNPTPTPSALTYTS